MKTQQTHTGTLVNPEAPGVAAINVPLSSLSELDVAAQDLLEEVKLKLSERTARTLGFVFLHPGGVTTARLRILTELDRTLLSPILTRLVRSGYIDRVAYGVYQRNPRTYTQPKLRLEAEDLLGLSSSPKPHKEAPVSPRAKELEALDPAGRAVLDGLRQTRSEKTISILEVMFLAEEPLSISEATWRTGFQWSHVASTLNRFAKLDILEPVGRGVYQWSPRTYEDNLNLGL